MVHVYIFIWKKYKILGIDKKNTKLIKVEKCNLVNFDKINKLLKKEKPDLIIHLAAQSLVDETIHKKKYVTNNVVVTKNLVKAMRKNNLNNLIFSSTAAVYKFMNKKITENSPISPKSTYASTKLACEKIIKILN